MERNTGPVRPLVDELADRFSGEPRTPGGNRGITQEMLYGERAEILQQFQDLVRVLPTPNLAAITDLMDPDRGDILEIVRAELEHRGETAA
jgi:hypothetical protein